MTDLEDLPDGLRKDLISCLSLARSCLKRCPAAVHLIDNGFDGTHHADIMIRADGQDYHAEADWARHALRLLRKIALANNITELPNWQEPGTTPLNEWRPPARSGGGT